ncbi:MAG: DUF3352 domain-containing protein [Planctomycetota bacterium]|nr:MAG: DUF3352 domain-containing protein [Planctomycetota bacterium]
MRHGHFGRMMVCGTAMVAALWSAGIKAEDEAVPADRLLPPGVLLHVRISDVSDLRERLPETGFGQMYKDGSMDKVREQIEKGFEQASEQAGKELGFPISELLNLPQGEFCLSLLQPAGRNLAGVAFLDIGDQESTLDKALAKLDEGLTKSGATKKSETVEEVEVTIYEFPKADSEEKNTFCYFVADGIMVAGSDLGVLSDVLSRWDGDSDDVLAEEEVYSYIREKCATRSEGSSVVEWYVDPMGLITAALNSSEELSTQALMVSAYLPTLGLDKFKAMGGNVDVAEGDYDVHGKSLLYVDQPTTGVLRAMECPAIDLAPPAWVSAATPQYASYNWDIHGAYDAITEMVDTLMGQPGFAGKQVDQAATQAGFHPKKDLIDHLDGRVVMAMDIDPENEQMPQKYLFALKLKDTDAFRETLGIILAQAGGAVTEREFEGTKIYDVQAPGQPISPAFSIAKDYLMFGTSAEMVEAAVRTSSDDSLADSEGFKSIAELMPDAVSAITYADLAKQLKPSYEMLRSGKLDGLTEGAFDFSIIPEFDKIEKFFSVSGGYTIPDEKGVFTETFMFAPEE